jgi:hypothetical protein
MVTGGSLQERLPTLAIRGPTVTSRSLGVCCSRDEDELSCFWALWFGDVSSLVVCPNWGDPLSVMGEAGLNTEKQNEFLRLFERMEGVWRMEGDIVSRWGWGKGLLGSEYVEAGLYGLKRGYEWESNKSRDAGVKLRTRVDS